MAHVNYIAAIEYIDQVDDVIRGMFPVYVGNTHHVEAGSVRFIGSRLASGGPPARDGHKLQGQAIV